MHGAVKEDSENQRSNYVMVHKGKEYRRRAKELRVETPQEVVMPPNERFITMEGAMKLMASRDGENVEIRLRWRSWFK